MKMSNNYNGASYYFAQPPPSYSMGSYNWQLQASHNARSVQETKCAPPLPPDPPPQQPPPPSSRPPSQPQPSVSSSSASVDQKVQAYYNNNNNNNNNSSSQGSYRNRRYNPASSGNYSGGQYGASSGHYNSSAGHYSSGQQYMSYISAQNYARMYYTKRKPEPDPETLKKANKKKKKPLSQNIPQRKDWSVHDAKRALTVEKEYNKRHRSQSLIIKFPDLELNREIVAKFHSSIDSVHFQQPSTPRFCFVTLKDSANPDCVIRDLNKIPFGHGFLTAEYKKDREDEINIGPEDIDPLTLYVGNLAQEITKEDMVNTYPKQKRIDIGYAKKMKYTRYAFVSFKNVDDSIEAFRKTHATQMYSKSLIVRFRRLNGTVGMPGEPKPQMPQRSDSCTNHRPHNGHNDLEEHSPEMDMDSNMNSRPAPWEMVDVSNWETDEYRGDDMWVKEEPQAYSDYEDEDQLPTPRRYRSSYPREDMEVLPYSMHRNFVPKIKLERNYYEEWQASHYAQNGDTTSGDRNRPRTLRENGDYSESYVIPIEKIKKEDDDFPYENNYSFLKQRHRNRVDNYSSEVKREPSPVPDERAMKPSIVREAVLPDERAMKPSIVRKAVLPDERAMKPSTSREAKPQLPPLPEKPAKMQQAGQSSAAQTAHASEPSPEIKNEPLDEGNGTDEDDDYSSDGSGDNINNILSNVKGVSKRLKKKRF